MVIPNKALRLSIFAVAYLLVLFNAVDGLLTYLVVDAGLASEANPFIAWFVMSSPVLYFVTKLFLSIIGFEFFKYYNLRMSTYDFDGKVTFPLSIVLAIGLFVLISYLIVLKNNFLGLLAY